MYLKRNPYAAFITEKGNSMSKCNDIDAEMIRLAADKKAKELGFSTGSEEYFRLLAEEAMTEASFDCSMGKPRPLFYKCLDETLDGSVDLVLVELEHLDYLCHALAIERDPRKFALVPPKAEIFDMRSFRTDERGQNVIVRGTGLCSYDEWKAYIDDLSVCAEVLGKCFNKDTERFLGLLGVEGQLGFASEGNTIGLVRLSPVQNNIGYPHDPLSAIKQNDLLLEHIESHASRCVSAIVWECEEAGDKDLGLVCTPAAKDDVHMCKVVELPKDYKCQLFIWDSWHNSYIDQVAMVAIDEWGNERSVEVLGAELALNSNYSPTFYLNSQGGEYYKALKEIVRKIRRGTSLKGKDLSICGDAMDDDPFENGFPLGIIGRGDERGCYRSYKSYYVDNASIKSESDGIGRFVVAKRIEEIPSRQERYTLLPEDGLVLLLPRNGKNAVCYYAAGPTLVSNNLFIIWPDLGKVDPKYLAIALNSLLVTSQFDSNKSVLGKSDLEKLLIPMASKDVMSAVVARKQEIHEKIDELRHSLDRLRREDPLEQIRRIMTDQFERSNCKRVES